MCVLVCVGGTPSSRTNLSRFILVSGEWNVSQVVCVCARVRACACVRACVCVYVCVLAMCEKGIGTDNHES